MDDRDSPSFSSSSRRRFLGLAGAALVVGAAGCLDEDGDDEEPTPTPADPEPTPTPSPTPEPPETTDDPHGAVEEGDAVVRVAHLSPDAPAVDVFLDGAVAFSDLAFREVSAYVVLEPGTYEIEVAPAGEETPVGGESVELDAEAHTVAALGEVSGVNQPLEIVSFVDEVEPPGEGEDEARVRLLHAVPDAPAVDVLADDEPLFEDVSFGESSDYATVAADEYELDVVAEDETVATVEAEFEPGVGSGFAVGYLTPDEAPVPEEFDVEWTVDSGGQ